MLITRFGCRLIGWLALVCLVAGCAVAAIVVGVVVDAGVGTVGIVQRQQHQNELEKQTAELTRVRAEVACLRLQTARAEILRGACGTP